MSGWIKLHRKFVDWEWFYKSEMVHIFLFLLLSANHKGAKWQGIEIKRGQLITGLKKLNKKTGISLQKIRTCLKKLENTNEIIVKSTNKFSIITICKYDSYQIEQETNNKQLTNKQQTTNKQLTTTNNDNNKNNDNNIDIYPSFNDFWNLYDKKIDRPKSLLKWNKLNQEQKEKIINYLPDYIKSTPEKSFRKNPTTFFNNQSWNNEIIKDNSQSSNQSDAVAFITNLRNQQKQIQNG